MYDNRKSYLLRVNTYNIPDDMLEKARGDLVLLKENAQIKVKLNFLIIFSFWIINYYALKKKSSIQFYWRWAGTSQFWEYEKKPWKWCENNKWGLLFFFERFFYLDLKLLDH